MADTILVVVEQREGKLNPVSWETITAGQAIAAAIRSTLEAAVVGSGAATIAAEAGTSAASVETVNVEIADGVIRNKPQEVFKEAKQAVDLTQAEVIVAVGRGIKEQKNIEIAKQLADALGGDLAASRPICDSGWLPMDRQIGSSGQTVAPKLYLALGISGAIQHIVGMKGSRAIIAVNKDSEAPIFEIADYAVVGNLFDIVPPLIEEVKKAKAAT